MSTFISRGATPLISIPFEHHYLQLGEEFYVKKRPVQVDAPALIIFNHALAENLGLSLGDLPETELAAIFSGNRVPEGAEPLAMAYAGHQFGQFVPQLGDGRAILLGEITTVDGVSYDVQLKGSGRTGFSRGGDGRSALGPVLREYLVSEAMAKLGVPTTRALAAVTTGQEVVRERVLPGGVITRVAAGFVRVGTFEYFRARGDVDAIRKLADHVIHTHYASLAQAGQPYETLLQSVVDRQAILIARWMQLGFIHGVMNTDNMSLTGETIDYGPCAFMDAYQHDKVFSSIDHSGRYAYRQQPAIGLWNLTRLAECLLPLFADDTETAISQAEEVLNTFQPRYDQHWLDGMRAKCGLTAVADAEQEDRALINGLLDMMAANRTDFTLMFYHLSRLDARSSAQDAAVRDLFDDKPQVDDWLVYWRKRLDKEPRGDAARQQAMQAVNPVYIPRNHQVEAAIRAAEDRGDFSVFHALHAVLQAPFTEQAGMERYTLPPRPEEEVRQTFCGT